MSVAKSSIKIKYIIAVILMLLFVLNDLVFDFLFNFESSDYISFACTLIAAIIVFYCNFTIKKGKITTEFENAETFIKSNFDNWQVAFSILDIICGVISILSGIALLGAIFKVVKIGYVPIKIAVVTNKGKSLVKAVSKVSLIWTSGRLLSNNENRENSSMKKIGKAFKNIGLWIFSNKKSITGTLAGLVAGVATALAVHGDIIAFLPALVVFGIDIMPYLAGLVIFGLTELGVTGKGFETIKQFAERVTKAKEQKQVEKVLKAEEKKEAQAEKEKKEIAKKQETENKKAEKLLKKLEAEQKALQEKKAAEEAKKAEQERLLALAMAMKAEKEQQKVDAGDK